VYWRVLAVNVTCVCASVGRLSAIAAPSTTHLIYAILIKPCRASVGFISSYNMRLAHTDV